MNQKILFHVMGISQKEYIIRFVIPIMSMGIIFPVVLVLVAPDLLQGNLRIILYLIPVMLFFLVMFYPFTVFSNKKLQIDENMHYYITHLGVLSTSQMSRKELLKRVASNEAYGYLAEETDKIYMLMNDWGLSFAQACRFIARRTPSELYADFLDRFAHALDSGENLETFLKTEQKVVMNDFDTMYKAALHSIEVVKETFVSMVMALVFLVSFAIIMPILTGMDATLLMVGTIFIFVGTEALLVYFARMKVPGDRIWHTLPIETEADRAIKISFPISLLVCMIVSVPVIFLLDFPFTISLSIILTPLVLTGQIASRAENRIKRKDNNFSSFIRSLGSSSGARGGLINESLRQLTYHDFGPLTKDVTELYKRITTRIDKMKSWNYFAAGTGSNLIERFGNIFAEGTHIGGKPEVIGEIIADNFMHIVSLRKLRYNSSSSLVGIMYGLTAGIAFTLYIALSVVGLMNSIFTTADIPEGMDMGLYLGSGGMDVALVSSLLMALLVFHSLISSLLIRIVDGGHFFNIYTHFVGLLWTSSICGEMAMRSSGSLLGIT
ncbi:archaellar assembly protein FlaJ [candidate division WOR-3 bacterium]|nr:archaellar assembly protein FlaJ [candidate division WOR-3 bacterium]